jgi:hypothetical protein
MGLFATLFRMNSLFGIKEVLYEEEDSIRTPLF